MNATVVTRITAAALILAAIAPASAQDRIQPADLTYVGGTKLEDTPGLNSHSVTYTDGFCVEKVGGDVFAYVAKDGNVAKFLLASPQEQLTAAALPESQRVHDLVDVTDGELAANFNGDLN